MEQHDKEEVTTFAPNSFVLVTYPDGAMGPRPPSKLHANLKGPFRVISNVGRHYTLYDMVESKQQVHHVKTLRPYHSLANNWMTPADVALKG